MNQQEMYSLAIQALHERIDWIRRMSETPQNSNAVRECELTITFLMGIKEISQFINGFKDTCTGEIRIVERDE